MLIQTLNTVKVSDEGRCTKILTDFQVLRTTDYSMGYCKHQSISVTDVSLGAWFYQKTHVWGIQYRWFHENSLKQIIAQLNIDSFLQLLEGNYLKSKIYYTASFCLLSVSVRLNALTGFTTMRLEITCSSSTGESRKNSHMKILLIYRFKIAFQSKLMR